MLVLCQKLHINFEHMANKIFRVTDPLWRPIAPQGGAARLTPVGL